MEAQRSKVLKFKNKSQGQSICFYVSSMFWLLLIQVHVENPNYVSLESIPPESTQFYLHNGSLMNQQAKLLSSQCCVWESAWAFESMLHEVPSLPLTLDLGRFCQWLAWPHLASLSVFRFGQGTMEHNSWCAVKFNWGNIMSTHMSNSTPGHQGATLNGGTFILLFFQRI